MAERPTPDLTSPAVRAALIRGLASRRAVMTGALGLGATAALAACGSEGTGGTPSGSATPTAKAAQDMSDTEKVVNWSNWPQYIDVSEDEKSRPTLDAFTKATGIQVNYTEDYNDNDEFYAKVRPLLEGGQDTGRDVWCSTDWMVARLIRQGYVQALDTANIPNAENLEESLKNVEFDPGRKFSLPWQSGFAGIGYNLDATGGKKIETITQLLTDPTLKGKVTLLLEMRDTVGLVLLRAGQGPGELHRRRLRRRHRHDPEGQGRRARSRASPGNDYTDGLTKGDIAACVAWTGDVVQLQFDNDKVAVRPAPGRLHPVVGQLRHPGAGQAQEERRDPHQLLLRPRRHGRGRGVGQLHPAGRRHQGRARQDRPRARREPAHRPHARGARPARRCSAA